MLQSLLLSLSTVLILAAPSVDVAEKVALRAANGRFLRVNGDGTIRAESFYPSEKETFELVSRGQHEVTLQGQGGRYLVPDPHDGHTPRLGPAGAQPGDRETFKLVPLAASRFALRPHGSSGLLVFSRVDQHPADTKTTAGPPPRDGLEIYRLRELPAILQTALPVVIRSLATEELAGKQYDKTQKHETQKYIELPAPTLSDPKRKKRHQVLGITEEYRIQAELDAQAEIHIPAMSFLANYADGGPGLILLAVEAGLPVRGRVQCKVPDLASASTGYHLKVQLSAVAEVAARHTGNDVTFDPPVVSDLHVSVSRMEFSNDLLEVLRRQIRHVVNRELAHNEQRIRESANQALQKAIAARQVRIPLLGFFQLL